MDGWKYRHVKELPISYIKGRGKIIFHSPREKARAEKKCIIEHFLPR